MPELLQELQSLLSQITTDGLLQALYYTLLLSGLCVSLIGLVTVVQFIRPKKAPMDGSNRINHIRLWWFAMTRPEIFADKFEWLKNDELDNMKK